LIPNFIKNRFINWYLLRCRWSINGFNRLAKYYNVAPVKRFLDIFRGDYTFVADDINFLNLKPTSDFPLKNFIGPILIDQPFKQSDKMLDSDVETHLRRSNRSILFTLGSSGSKKIYLEILKTLNKTNYNVIAVYTTILKEDELPKLNDNILLKRFVPSIKKINENVDLAIIHGGRGTVYTAAFSGKPVIGIPMHSEQQFNIDNLVRHGSAIRLSKKYFNEKQFLLAIKKIFDNHDSYLGNAQSLKNKLQNQNGVENAVKRILEILNKNDKN
jgi:UDP:flavonoid glycosyltransferase YjiC (YdhE family)